MSDSGYTKFFGVITGWIGLGIVLALSLPEDALMRWPWARVFTDAIAGFIPAIDRITVLSSFPQVTRLFGSIFWALVPAGVLLLVAFPEPVKLDIGSLRAHRWRTALGVPMLALAMLAFMYFFPLGTTAGDLRDPTGHGEWLIALMSTSRFWLGAVGSTAFLGLVVMLYAAVRAVLLVPSAFSDNELASDSINRESGNARKQ